MQPIILAVAKVPSVASQEGQTLSVVYAFILVPAFAAITWFLLRKLLAGFEGRLDSMSKSVTEAVKQGTDNREDLKVHKTHVEGKITHIESRHADLDKEHDKTRERLHDLTNDVNFLLMKAGKPPRRRTGSGH